MLEGTLLYIVLGSTSGFLAGLLGIGGGVIVVPGLAYIFSLLHFDPTVIMHMAAGTSLGAIIFTMLVAVLTHRKRNTIEWNIVWRLLPGFAIGAILGALLAADLPTKILKIIFAIFLVAIAVKLFLQKKSEDVEPVAPKLWVQWLAGIAIGISAGLLGVGGGVLAIPILLRFGLKPHNAAATSSACSLFLSIVGTLSFIAVGWHDPALPVGSTGYVYWPAVLGIAVFSSLLVPLGANLARRLSGDALQRIFAVFLLIIAVDMMI